MLRSMDQILGYSIRATDGEVGSAADFYFDDREWTVRYLIVSTGFFLPGRRILISPEEIEGADWRRKHLELSLTCEKIRNSPELPSELPVSRKDEEALGHYYGWVPYWGGTFGAMGAGHMVTAAPGTATATKTPDEPPREPDLRSVRELLGYSILATDGLIGHVEDLIADTDTWAIRYLVVDTRNWLPGRKVLIATGWATHVDWSERVLHLDLTQQQIKNSPPFDPSTPINHDYEARLYDYYGRPCYWK